MRSFKSLCSALLLGTVMTASLSVPTVEAKAVNATEMSCYTFAQKLYGQSRDTEALLAFAVGYVAGNLHLDSIRGTFPAEMSEAALLCMMDNEHRTTFVDFLKLISEGYKKQLEERK